MSGREKRNAEQESMARANVKRSRRFQAEDDPETERKRKEYVEGEKLWIDNSWAGLIEARGAWEENIGGVTKSQYNFYFKGCKKKVGPDDHPDVLAIEGKTLFSGYDALYRATLSARADGEITSDGGVKLRKDAYFNHQRIQGLSSETSDGSTTTASSDRTHPSVTKATAASSSTASSERLDIHRLRGGNDAIAHIILPKRVSPADWDQGPGANSVTYKHLEKVLDDPMNHVYVGSVNGDIISLFCFRCGGNQGDLTITLLWTRGPYRRIGYSKALIGIGIEDLICGDLAGAVETAVSDDSYVISGSNDSTASQHLYKSLDFKKMDVAYAISTDKLLKSLHKHGDKMKDQGWQMNIALWNADEGIALSDADKKLPARLESQRDQWNRGQCEMIDLTNDKDDVVDLLFSQEKDAKPAATTLPSAAPQLKEPATKSDRTNLETKPAPSNVDIAVQPEQKEPATEEDPTNFEPGNRGQQTVATSSPPINNTNAQTHGDSSTHPTNGGDTNGTPLRSNEGGIVSTGDGASVTPVSETKSDAKKESSPFVMNWLASKIEGLNEGICAEYASHLVDKGFDCKGSLVCLEEEDVTFMLIGHKKAIKKALNMA